MNILTRIKSVFGVSGGSFILDWARTGAWTKASFLSEYKRYVYTTISAISEDVATIEFVVENASGEVIENHEFNKLMRQPNPDSSQFQFIELHQTFMELMGESFWYVVRGNRTRTPKALYLLRPDYMSVVISDDEFGNVKGYVLTKPNGEKVPFERDEVIHHKMPNPVDPYRGYGTLEAAQMYVQTEQYASDFTRHALMNSGRPSGLVSIKGTIPEDDFKQLKKSFTTNYTGVENAGKLAFLRESDGITFSKMGIDLGEAGIESIKNMSRDDIMAMWRVSKPLLGITDDVNRANAKESHLIWIQRIIKPKMSRLVDTLDSQLFIATYPKNNVTFRDPSPESVEDRLNEWDKGLNRYLTVNEIRKERSEILGVDFEPLQGGDELYIPFNLVPLGKTPEKPEPVEESIKPATKRFDLQHNRYEVAERFRTLIFERAESWIPRYADKLRVEFDNQRREVLARLGVSSKALNQFMFDSLASQKRLVELLTPLVTSLVLEQSKVAFELAGNGDAEPELDFDTTASIRQRIERFAKDTNDLTINKLSDALSQGIADGKTIAELAGMVEDIYENANSVRAEMIARTEVAHASNTATEYAYRNSPAVVAKEWFANPDACEFCDALNGSIVTLDHSFVDVGGSVQAADGNIFSVNYDTVGGPPLHPNCFDKETSVLTDEGWKLFKDVRGDEGVMSVDLSTGNSEWVGIKHKVSYKYSGELVHYTSNNCDLMVTPDHNQVVKFRQKSKGRADAGVWKLIQEKELPNHDFSFLGTIPAYLGESPETIEIGKHVFNTKQFAEFMGYYLSEGHISKPAKGSWQIGISQQKQPNYDKICSLLQNMFDRVWVGAKTAYIPLQDEALIGFFRDLGKSYEKYIPQEVKDLDKDTLRIFLDAYLMGDGSIKKGKFWKGYQFSDEKTYFTTSAKMASDLGELMLKTGTRPSYSEEQPGEVKHRNGTYTGNHVLHRIRENVTASPNRAHLDKVLVAYDDFVYDVELEKYHTLIVKRNGKVLVSGNCECTLLPVSDLQFSLHRITTMHREYEDMDKRTKDAKELLKDLETEKENLNKERHNLDTDKKEVAELLEKIENLL